jgi:hypothetical protein
MGEENKIFTQKRRRFYISLPPYLLKMNGEENLEWQEV